MRKTLVVLLWCLSCSVYAGDDIMIYFYEKDASRHATERNLIKVEDGHIYHLYNNDKGALRKLFPGELEKIKHAMKSQLAYTALDNQAKPNEEPYYEFGFEYDVGIRDIKYEIRSISIHNELSAEMMAIFDEYFHHQFK